MKLDNFSFVTEVHKLELHDFLKSVVDIVEKHDPIALSINGMFQLLKAEIPSVNELVVATDLSLPSTKSKVALGKQLNGLVSALYSQCRAIERANLVTEKQSREIVVPGIVLHLKAYSTVNLTKKLEIVSKLLLSLEGDDVKDALTDLGLLKIVDELKAVYALLKVHTTVNQTTVNTRKPSNFVSVKANALTAFRNLMKAINLACVEHKDKDYSGLLTELNNYLNSVSSKVKSRSTRRMNSSKKETVASTPTSIATAS